MLQRVLLALCLALIVVTSAGAQVRQNPGLVFALLPLNPDAGENVRFTIFIDNPDIFSLGNIAVQENNRIRVNLIEDDVVEVDPILPEVLSPILGSFDNGEYLMEIYTLGIIGERLLTTRRFTVGPSAEIYADHIEDFRLPIGEFAGVFSGDDTGYFSFELGPSSVFTGEQAKFTTEQ